MPPVWVSRLKGLYLGKVTGDHALFPCWFQSTVFSMQHFLDKLFFSGWAEGMLFDQNGSYNGRVLSQSALRQSQGCTLAREVGLLGVDETLAEQLLVRRRCHERRLVVPHVGLRGYQCENNYFTEMCSASEAGSYLRLVDFVYHSTLGLRVIKKKKKVVPHVCLRG